MLETCLTVCKKLLHVPIVVFSCALHALRRVFYPFSPAYNVLFTCIAVSCTHFTMLSYASGTFLIVDGERKTIAKGKGLNFRFLT